MRRVVLLCIIIVFPGICLTVGLLIHRLDRTSMASTPSLSMDSERLVCGPKSLCIAIRRLGVPVVDTRPLYEACENGKGVEFGVLETLTSQFPDIKVVGLQHISWEDLVNLDGTAVLFVNGNHFVAVDPRERPASSMSPGVQVRVYDPGHPARWYTRNKLEEIWKGEALILKKGTTKQLKSGPKINWDTCWVDTGFFTGDQTIECPFKLTNTDASG